MHGTPDGDRRAWAEAISGVVLDQMRAVVCARAVNWAQRDAMLEAIAAGRAARHPERLSPALHVPILCAAAVRPGAPAMIDVAVATALLWTGLELYDDLTDGDLAPALRARPDHEIVFTAFALACLVPTALLADLDVPADTRLSLQRLLAPHLLHAFAGQAQDLGHVRRNDVGVEAVAWAVRGKNGAPGALFAALGAAAAGAGPAAVDAYARYGEHLGIVAQYQSDFWELFFDPAARDLVQGNRTLQIASALAQADPAERHVLVGLLERAPADAAAREGVRTILRDARHVGPWRRAVATAAASALAALEEARPHEPAATVLRDLVRERTPYC